MLGAGAGEVTGVARGAGGVAAEADLTHVAGAGGGRGRAVPGEGNGAELRRASHKASESTRRRRRQQPKQLGHIVQMLPRAQYGGEQLALGDTRPLTIESQVSNRAKHLLDNTNPPPQIVCGPVGEGQTQKPNILFRFRD